VSGHDSKPKEGGRFESYESNAKRLVGAKTQERVILFTSLKKDGRVFLLNLNNVQGEQRKKHPKKLAGEIL